MRTPAAPGQLPPPLELMCLRALWTLREANVEQVRRVLSEKKPLAYTTVMTLLDRLARKGVVTRRKQGRAFVYQPQISRETLLRLAVKEFVDSHFDGSEDELLEFLKQAERTNTPMPSAPVFSEERMDTVLL